MPLFALDEFHVKTPEEISGFKAYYFNISLFTDEEVGVSKALNTITDWAKEIEHRVVKKYKDCSLMELQFILSELGRRKFRIGEFPIDTYFLDEVGEQKAMEGGSFTLFIDEGSPFRHFYMVEEHKPSEFIGSRKRYEVIGVSPFYEHKVNIVVDVFKANDVYTGLLAPYGAGLEPMARSEKLTYIIFYPQYIDYPFRVCLTKVADVVIPLHERRKGKETEYIVYNIIQTLMLNEECALYNKIKEEVSKQGVSEEALNKAMRKLMRHGEIYERRTRCYAIS